MEQLDTEKLIGELEVAVDRLRALYEQYFMGFEKLEPTVPRKDVDRRIYVLRKEQLRNTALRFRFNMLLQRYNTYQTHWQRICREIENGTYKRHILRAQQRFAERRRSSAPPPSNDALQLAAIRIPVMPALSDAKAAELAELDAEFAPRPGMPRPDAAASLGRGPDATPRVAPPPPLLPTSAPRVPPLAAPAATVPRPAPPLAPLPRPAGATAPGRPPPPPPPPSAPRIAANAPQPPAIDGLSEARVRQLYAQYVDARRRQNESTASITYEAVAKSLRDSQTKLREKHGKTVDFEVSVRDGKAILKPVLK